MAKFKTLENIEGKPLIVNVDQVSYITVDDDGVTSIVMVSGIAKVSQSPQEVRTRFQDRTYD